jgi:sarcosine oxidase, subunit beta
VEAKLALNAIPPRAEVVIIGGGVIGTSCAFHLAEAGVSEVVLVERDSLGSGSTCKAVGGVRSSFTNPANIDVHAGAVTAVRTDAGTIRTSAVVCAAGAWSAPIGAMAGVDLPVTPYRRQVVFTGPIPDLPDHLPMTIDFPSTLYFHGEGRGLVLGFSDPDEQPGFNLNYETEDWLPRLFALVERRAPSILDAGLTTGWAGLYEITPDHNQLIGEDGEVSRFLYATGFSGHGFLMGPAVGEIIRDLYLGRPPFLDSSGFDVRRFSDPAAALTGEHNIV